MDTADPLCAVSSTTHLLRRTLGPAPAASPSKADEALLQGISGMLKGSKELIEQTKIAMKGYGDIGMVYQDDGGKAAGAANCKNSLLGRRPAGERKRYHFTMKYPTSKPPPVVDRSVLDTISDPDEYYAKELQLDEAEAEIKRLTGQPKRTLNFEPVAERKRRNPSRPRKSYSFSSYSQAANAPMIPASQPEVMTESQTSQDDAHASVSERNEQSVPSRSNNCAISDSLAEEDSFAENDNGDEISNIMASFYNYDGPDKLGHLRKTIGIGEIRTENIYCHDSFIGDMPLGSSARINPQEVRTLENSSSGSDEARDIELAKHIFSGAVVDKQKDPSKGDGFEGHTLEKPVPGSYEARVSELAARIFRYPATDKHIDDEFEGSPDIVMAEQSLLHDSSDVVLMTDETSAREKDKGGPSPSAKSAEHVFDPEQNIIPDCVTIDDDPCNRHTIPTEEDNVHVDNSTIDESIAQGKTIDKSNNEAVISSHHLDDASEEVLANTPGRNVAPDDIARTSSEDNIQHQEIVEEDGVVQDKSVHSLEIPLEDIGPQNQSQAPDGTIKKLVADLGSALSPTKEKAQKTAQRGKTRQQLKRGNNVADDTNDSLEIPQADFDPENQPHDVNTEKLVADQRNTLSPTKAAQKGKSKQRPKRGKKVSDEPHHSLEMPQPDFDSENQSDTHDVNSETVVMRNPPSPRKEQKGPQRRNKSQELNKRKSLADAGLEWQSGVRRSKRIRHRPLEQWRGERFIYGRIHETMVTVIGVKSYSPDQDGKRALKVKSFVPEQYSDVVAQGAKY